MKRSYILIVILIIVLAGAATVAVSHKKTVNAPAKTSDNMPSMSTSDNGGATVATSSVAIQNFAFSPANITVKMGTKVTWTNKDNVAHTVTATTPSSDAPSSSDIAPNATYSFTFNKVGTYAYECSIHPSMQGKVTVTN